MKLSGKVAVITGAARGIGRACAERFLKEGAKVVVSDIDADGLARTASNVVGGKFDYLVIAVCIVRGRHALKRLAVGETGAHMADLRYATLLVIALSASEIGSGWSQEAPKDGKTYSFRIAMVALNNALG